MLQRHPESARSVGSAHKNNLSQKITLCQWRTQGGVQVASEAEIEELKQLKEKKDKKTLEAKVLEYKARLPEQKRKMLEVWEVCSLSRFRGNYFEKNCALAMFQDSCRALWKDELSRKRRDIDKNFEDFTKWMTAEQKKEVRAMVTQVSENSYCRGSVVVLHPPR
ncbi:hypothetical protein Y032_0024g917 [Ancylostoma ceylanicum]|uniref:Uncharacterized protein n=1 Tax=Ancylostoma ceylanicum TaxID=53326 RepID=A0A016UVV0_9BILA|nr:hypothetical protein Y032_0024g917 [Ancylostoma ceylanicum]